MFAAMTPVRAFLAIALIAGSGACGGHGTKKTTTVASTPLTTAGEITLYKDGAQIRRRIDIDIPASNVGVAKVRVGAGVTIEEVSVVDRGGLTVREIRAAGGTASGSGDPTGETLEINLDDLDPQGAATRVPHDIEIEVGAPKAGKYSFVVAYSTTRIKWDAAYTITASPSHDDAELAGAIAIRNQSGIDFKGTHLLVVDELIASAKKEGEELGAGSGSGSGSGSAAATPEASATPVSPPRDLGNLDLDSKGETRVELVRAAHRKMRSVLVFDPIGTKYDSPSSIPIRDENLALHPKPETTVAESVEIQRDKAADAGLPGGPARLLERKTDGSLVVLAEARLFDATTRVAASDTITVGVASDVTATRERHDFSVDEERKRLVEEFAIDITSKRKLPTQVIVREHMYRGQNWSIAYNNIVLTAADKEGAQQVSMRTSVPPNGKARVYYVVVYTWK